MTDHRTWMTNLNKVGRLLQEGPLRDMTALFRRRGHTDGVDGRSSRTDDPFAQARDRLGSVLEQAGHGLQDLLHRFDGAMPVDPFGRSSKPETVEDGTFVERSFANSAGQRDYKLFIPRQSGLRPLIVMLHGCTQSPDDFAAGTRMNGLADREGIYVAYPRQTRSANAQKCWNWFEPGHQGREHGESSIIAGLTRAIIAEHRIDPARVYIAGMSAGGAAAANMARAYPDLYAAVGIHSGLAAGCAHNLASALMAMKAGAPGAELPGATAQFGAGSSASAHRIPTIVFHGASDAIVNAKNAEAALVQAGISDLEPTREEGQVPNGHRYTRTRYRDADGRVAVEAWRLEGFGHAWSGGSKDGSYTDPQGPDASHAMLDFFLTHRLAGAAPR